MKKNIPEDGIDLLKVFFTILQNKILITQITFITIVITLGIHFTKLNKYESETNINPISIFESNRYLAFNSLSTKENNLFMINREFLLNLFVDKLNKRDLFEEAIIKFKLFEKKKPINESQSKNYLDNSEIKILAKKLAFSIELIPPIQKLGSERYLGAGGSNPNWIIKHKIYDTEKWNNALLYIDKQANLYIKNYLVSHFNNTISLIKKKRQFEIEDFDRLIINIKKDYKRITSDRLAFLKEQVSIARKLDIASNTMKSQDFIKENVIVSTLNLDNSYYLRGYNMIEEEINLIESRSNEEAFIKNLLNLENQKRSLLENKDIERIESIFNDTPILNSEEFNASSIINDTTTNIKSRSLMRMIFLGFITGLLISIFYIFIRKINTIKQIN